MALGLVGARGERHVLRRRSACDWAAFLWGLAGTQAGAGRGKGLGGGGWRGWLWRPEEEEMAVGVLPLPHTAYQLPQRGGGWRAEGHSLPGVTAVGGGLAPCFVICLSPCKAYLRWQVPIVEICINCEPLEPLDFWATTQGVSIIS